MNDSDMRYMTGYISSSFGDADNTSLCPKIFGRTDVVNWCKKDEYEDLIDYFKEGN